MPMKTAAVALALCLERASATACSCKATWSNSYCSDQEGCPPSTCDSWRTNWCEVEPDGCDGSSYDGTGFYWMECEASPAPTASLAPTVSPAPTVAPSTTAAPSVNLWAGCNWIESDSNTDGQQNIGSAASPDDCIAMVQAQCPTATIANIDGSGSGGCWCQYGFNPTPDTDGYMSCVLHTLPGANATNLNFTLDHNPAQCQVAWNDGRCRELFPSDNCCAPPGRQACADLLGATGDVVETYQMVQTGKTCKDENGNPDSSEFNCYTCEAASTRRREG